MTQNSNLQNRAMLVNLTIRQWSARKHDKRITRDVAEREKASADVGRYNKRLLPKEALAFMQSASSAARLEHYKRTLPWSDDGPRILSSSGYFDYMRAIRELKRNFEQAADDFASKYEDFRNKAINELGHLYNEEDYPPPDKIRQRFAIEVSVMPLPNADDFRASLPADELEQVREDITKQVMESLKRGEQDVYRRAAEALTHMVNKLKEYTPGIKGERPTGIFRDSLVTNVNELTAIIPTLNVSDSEELHTLRDDLANLTKGIDAQDLREDDHLRKSTATRAQDILDKVNDFLA